MSILRFPLGSVLFFTLSLARGYAQDGAAMVVRHNLSYQEDPALMQDGDAESQCRLDLAYPQGANDFATVVWFHGGGLKGGSRFLPEKLMNKGIAVVAVSYRLFPEVSATVCIEDAAAAVAWVFKHIEDHGGRRDQIILSGHSAGGYLVSMLAYDKHWLAAHGIDANDLAGVVPFSGHTITHMTVREERGIRDTQPIVDALAPLYHVRADAPPTLLITGDRNLEMLGRYEENAYFWRMLKVVGHPEVTLYELDGYNHGGMAEPAFPLLLGFVRDLIPVGGD